MEMSDIVSIKQHTVMSRTIEYCESKIAEKDFTHITLVGEAKSVNKCISIAEILKRSHPNLIQDTKLTESTEHKDEPCLTIILSIP